MLVWMYDALDTVSQVRCRLYDTEVRRRVTIPEAWGGTTPPVSQSHRQLCRNETKHLSMTDTQHAEEGRYGRHEQAPITGITGRDGAHECCLETSSRGVQDDADRNDHARRVQVDARQGVHNRRSTQDQHLQTFGSCVTVQSQGRCAVDRCCGVTCECVDVLMRHMKWPHVQASARGCVAAGEWRLEVAYSRHEDVGADRKKHEDKMSCRPPSRLDDLQNCTHR